MSLAALSRSSSIQTRGRTYSVKILGERQVHACIEFPNANPPIKTPPRRSTGSEGSDAHPMSPITPRDKSRLNILRQDPSVASLLEMYDEQGRLDSGIFNNTIVAKEDDYTLAEGRAQVQRSGSTLRQLLGSPEFNDANGSTEGDISWAERLLGFVLALVSFSLRLILFQRKSSFGCSFPITCLSRS